jgi:hypothetical protein
MKKFILIIVFSALSSLSLLAQNKQADIQKAYQYLYLRDANAWESIPQNYNNGTWSNLEDLKKYVHEYNMKIGAAGITFKFSQQTFNNNTKVVGIFQNGRQIAADLVASGGGNLVASGGGNLIASGGGNLVASGGGNLVASGGGNIAVTTATKGASFGGSYTLASTGTTVIKTSGSGALIIK